MTLQGSMPYRVVRPPGNDRYVKHAPDNPKKVCHLHHHSSMWPMIDDVLDTL